MLSARGGGVARQRGPLHSVPVRFDGTASGDGFLPHRSFCCCLLTCLTRFVSYSLHSLFQILAANAYTAHMWFLSLMISCCFMPLKNISRNSYQWKIMVLFAGICEFRSPDQGTLFSLDFIIVDQQVISILFAFLFVKLFRCNLSICSLMSCSLTPFYPAL
jgi:hypothetical protein